MPNKSCSVFGAVLLSVFGALFIIISIAVLPVNEGRAHAEYASLREGLSIVSSLPDADTIDTSFNGQLVHASGMAAAQSQLNDSMFGVQEAALKLRRLVGMYQWVEYSNSTPRGSYYYRSQWVTGRVDSSEFKGPTARSNPPLPFPFYDLAADPTTFGAAFTLDSDVISKIDFDWYEYLTNIDSVDNIPDLSNISNRTILSNRTIRVIEGNRGYYSGGEGGEQEVGDFRVTFATIPYQNLSVVGRQSDSVLSAFVTSNGLKIVLVEQGLVSAEDMFKTANQGVKKEYNRQLILGSVALWFGSVLLVNAFSEFDVVIPFFGDFGVVTGGMRCTVPFLFAAAIETLIIAIMWLANQHRLALAILLLFGGLGQFYLIHRYLMWGAKRSKQANDDIQVPPGSESNGPVASVIAVHHQ